MPTIRNTIREEVQQLMLEQERIFQKSILEQKEAEILAYEDSLMMEELAKEIEEMEYRKEPHKLVI
jgi:hypothetical protein